MVQHGGRESLVREHRGPRLGKIMSKIVKETILLVSLLLIAALVQFYAQSLPMALCFYFLPTLYSAYHFGRRHATLTAFA
jgi:integral membrane sensor domain MASE1